MYTKIKATASILHLLFYVVGVDSYVAWVVLLIVEAILALSEVMKK